MYPCFRYRSKSALQIYIHDIYYVVASIVRTQLETASVNIIGLQCNYLMDNLGVLLCMFRQSMSSVTVRLATGPHCPAAHRTVEFVFVRLVMDE